MKGRLAPTLVLLALVACGGDASPPADSPPATSAAPEGVHGMAPAAVAGTSSVVTLEGPAAPAPTPRAEPPRIDQLGLVFTPPELVARVGETVVFTNSETISHNVHIRRTDSGETILNADTDPAGRVEHVFEEEGGYDISCDEHPGMRAFVYVTSAPYAVFAERTGEFVLPDVPEGTYTLSVWSVDPDLRSEQEVTVSGPSTEVGIGL